MKVKIFILGLICFLILICCKSPTSSNPSEFLGDTLAINYFMANPTNIILGKSSMLSWEIMNATKVSIDNGIGEVPLMGRIEVHPLETITYKLTASKNVETLTASREVMVDQNVACVIPIEENCYRIITGILYEGVIKNIGTKTAYQVEIRIRLYHGEEQIGYTLAFVQGPPMESGDIQGWETRWQTDINCWELELKYEITWEE